MTKVYTPLAVACKSLVPVALGLAAGAGIGLAVVAGIGIGKAVASFKKRKASKRDSFGRKASRQKRTRQKREGHSPAPEPSTPKGRQPLPSIPKPPKDTRHLPQASEKRRPVPALDIPEKAPASLPDSLGQVTPTEDPSVLPQACLPLLPAAKTEGGDRPQRMVRLVPSGAGLVSGNPGRLPSPPRPVLAWGKTRLFGGLIVPEEPSCTPLHPGTGRLRLSCVPAGSHQPACLHKVLPVGASGIPPPLLHAHVYQSHVGLPPGCFFTKLERRPPHV